VNTDVFRPSAAPQWMRCPASAVLSPRYPDRAGSAAQEGTLAHALAAWTLSTGAEHAEQWLREHPDGTPTWDDVDPALRVTREMCEYVQVYVDYCRREAMDYSVVIEEKMLFGHLLDLPRFAVGGTPDFVVLRPDGFAVVDLKYGYQPVSAQDSEQLRMYAAAILDAYEDLADFRFAKLVIVQPRIDAIEEVEIEVGELRKFVEEAKVAVARATVLADKMPQELESLSSEEIAAYFAPGEKQCRWCKAKAVCPGLRAEVALVTGAEFGELTQGMDDLSVPTASELLAAAMVKVDLIEQWCRAVRAETERLLLAGVPVPGFKLVQGRRGARQWTDVDEVEALLKKFRLKVEQMYNLKVISPTQAEKLLASSPRRWKQLLDLIEQKDGTPSVAPEADKRPALDMMPSADGMDIIDDDERN